MEGSAIGIEHFVTVSAMLFVLGVLGIFLNRKNVIVILMAIEFRNRGTIAVDDAKQMKG